MLDHDSVTPEFKLQILEGVLIAAGCFAVNFYLFSGAIPYLGLLSFTAILAIGIVLLMHSGGLYNTNALLNLKRMLIRIAVISIPIFALAVWTTGELARNTALPIYPYRWQWTGILAGFWVASAIALRVLFQHIHQSGAWTRRIILIGTSEDAKRLEDLAGYAQGRFQLMERFDSADHSIAGISPEEFLALAARTGVSEIVVAIGAETAPWKLIAQCKLQGVRVTDYLDFFERQSRQACIEKLREDWVITSGGFGGHGALRRIFDIVFSLAMLVITAPIFLLTAAAIKLEDGGSIIYGQQRTGFRGVPFVVYKFRSMREDAERDGTPTWASERDTRITKTGRVIRKLRIDELPQLVNVLRGNMTVIGPRPERPFFVHQFLETIPFYDFRHVVKPGITGWAQVSFRYGASLDDTKQKFSYDLYYVRNRSVWLDLVILFRTVQVVLSGAGAR
jgi:sugar transferase (PEP-CTERM system associated)